MVSRWRPRDGSTGKRRPALIAQVSARSDSGCSRSVRFSTAAVLRLVAVTPAFFRARRATWRRNASVRRASLSGTRLIRRPSS